MMAKVHPRDALYDGEPAFPVLPSCEHFAGSEKLIRKALQLQRDRGPVFDVTCDCEDGAAAGQETAHAQMVAGLIASAENAFGQVGVRIHDPAHPHWRDDVDIILDGCGSVVAYFTIPKPTCATEVATMIDYIRDGCRTRGIDRHIPVHVLIETHGALAQAAAIAALPWVQVLDFGQMDFVSAHHGAIPATALRSPQQFEHPLLVRAKCDLAAAALAHGVVPSHNVCLDLKNPETAFGDALRARREFGYLRMWSIHPIQIDAIVRAMQPDFSEVEDAAAILLAAQARDWGPIQHKGELHDRATYRYFWGVLQRAQVTGVVLPPEAQAAFFA